MRWSSTARIAAVTEKQTAASHSLPRVYPRKRARKGRKIWPETRQENAGKTEKSGSTEWRRGMRRQPGPLEKRNEESGERLKALHQVDQTFSAGYPHRGAWRTDRESPETKEKKKSLNQMTWKEGTEQRRRPRRRWTGGKTCWNFKLLRKERTIRG